MTVQRLAWLAVLSMLVTAAIVYALTAPPQAAPAPPPSDTVPTSSPTVFRTDAPAPPATLLPAPSGAPPLVVQEMLSAAADELLRFSQTDAASMSREAGVSLSAFLPQGHTMEQPFQLNSGKCYTLLAVSVGIAEFEISLVLSRQVRGVPAFARATSKGARASIGGEGRCFLWNFSASPANVVITATKGQGVAVAQLFVK